MIRMVVIPVTIRPQHLDQNLKALLGIPIGWKAEIKMYALAINPEKYEPSSVAVGQIIEDITLFYIRKVHG
jgi:hypothetical protein